MTIRIDNIGSGSSGSSRIHQYDSDPTSVAEDAWVLHTTAGDESASAGMPYGILMAITNPGLIGAHTYRFSYKTLQGTIKRVTIS